MAKGMSGYHAATNAMHKSSADRMTKVPARKAPKPTVKGPSLRGKIKQAAGT
jgi:hypothetical protein